MEEGGQSPLLPSEGEDVEAIGRRRYRRRECSPYNHCNSSEYESYSRSRRMYIIRDIPSEDEDRSYNSQESHPKRLKTTQTLKQDRISTMPDSVLLHVLSFLPTKYAIRTGALSQRWLYLWTSVPILDFTHDDESWDEDSTNEFFTFVDKALIFHKCCPVKKFTVKFNYGDANGSRVDTWVRFATRADVEELSLDLYGRQESLDGGGRYVLPQHVFANSSMTKLSLSWCDILCSGLISWKSLKSLSIGHTELSEDVIQKILVGSPVLESLELYKFCGFNRLDIGSSSLQKLVVEDYWDCLEEDEESELEISGPNLQSLCILGEMYRKKFKLINIQSLVACDLNFKRYNYGGEAGDDYEQHRNVLRELLVKLCHVKKLTMGNWCIQVLSIWELKGMLFDLSKCECLILDAPIRKCVFPGIVCLLHCSPNLKTFVINMTTNYYIEYGFDRKFPKNFWASRKGSFKCLLPLLKIVKIDGFVALAYEVGLIPLVSFLLKKASVLEKMIICSRRVNHSERLLKELLSVAQKLLSLRRSSPRAAVELSVRHK